MIKIQGNNHNYKIPLNYTTNLTGIELQKAIYEVLHVFETTLKLILSLTKIRSPIFIESGTDLNDGLSGEIPAKFNDKNNVGYELVHSLAKWKRQQLKELNLNNNEGIVTNMKAVRREETCDNIHSLFVDQWDWELKIDDSDRTLQTLMDTVYKIYSCIYFTANYVEEKYNIKNNLSKEIKFVTTQELENLYPNLSPKDREHEITRIHKAVCLIGIGDKLKSGNIHDNRAVDYDDWSSEIELNGIKTTGLNCDILLYNEVLDESLEISSMGIRVNSDVLQRQYCRRGVALNIDEHHNYTYQIVNNMLPQSIGGGIGQSRLLMFFLKKCHIGEVQVSCWPNKQWLLERGLNVL